MKTQSFIFRVLFCVLLMLGTLTSQAENSVLVQDATGLYMRNCPFVRVCDCDEVEFCDTCFYQVARPVLFKVDTWELSEGEELLEQLAQEVVPLAKANGWRLCRVELRGAASPEGPWHWNKVLADNRARVLMERLNEILPSYSRMDSVNQVVMKVVEDYPYLAKMMTDAKDPYARRVAEMVAYYRGNDLRTKNAIFGLMADKDWWYQYLLRKYFPQLRAARVVLFMRPVDVSTLSAEQRLAYEQDRPAKPTQMQKTSDVDTPAEPALVEPVRISPKETARPSHTMPAGLMPADGQEILAMDDSGIYLKDYPYVRLMENDSMRCDDSIFYAATRPVIFVVNKWDLSKNHEFLRQLSEEVVPLIAERGLRLSRVELRGAASPEGPWRWNQTLAKNRARVLTEQVNAIFPSYSQMDESQHSTVEVVEDYPYLVRLMREAGDPDAEHVAEIVERNKGNDLATKEAIRTMKPGKAWWSYLLHTYFPQLRASRVLLYVEPIDFSTLSEKQWTEYIKDHLKEAMLPVPTDWFITDLIMDTVPYFERDTTGWIPRKEVLAIKTNLLFDFAYVHGYGFVPALNGQIEYYPKHGHITPQISFDSPWWTYEWRKHKYFQVRNYQIEGRYYFRREDARYDGIYASVYAHACLYGVGFDGDTGWQGEGWGAGVGAGYVLPFSKDKRKYAHHWKLEFGFQVGYFQTLYDPYVYGCPVEEIEDGLYYYDWKGRADDFVPRQYRWQWFGPTRVGITLAYDLLYRKTQHKGISTIWREDLESDPGLTPDSVELLGPVSQYVSIDAPATDSEEAVQND